MPSLASQVGTNRTVQDVLRGLLPLQTKARLAATDIYNALEFDKLKDDPLFLSKEITRRIQEQVNIPTSLIYDSYYGKNNNEIIVYEANGKLKSLREITFGNEYNSLTVFLVGPLKGTIVWSQYILQGQMNITKTIDPLTMSIIKRLLELAGYNMKHILN